MEHMKNAYVAHVAHVAHSGRLQIDAVSSCKWKRLSFHILVIKMNAHLSGLKDVKYTHVILRRCTKMQNPSELILPIRWLQNVEEWLLENTNSF